MVIDAGVNRTAAQTLTRVRLGRWELRVLALYRSGASCREIAERTRRPENAARRVVERAGIGRTRPWALVLLRRRRAASRLLPGVDMPAAIDRVRGGADVTRLAGELEVDADLLWSTMCTILEITDPGFTAHGRTDCADRPCAYACIAACGASLNSGRGRRPLTPAGAA